MNDNNEDLKELQKICKNHTPRLPNKETCQNDIDPKEMPIAETHRSSSSSSTAKMWSMSGDSYFPTESSVTKLAPGQYIIRRSDSTGIYFHKQSVNLDDLMVLPDSNGEKVIQTIKHFWNSESKFREHGFLWKRGILLWGMPGSGKTSLVQQLSQQIIDIGGITIYCTHPTLTADGLSQLRIIEPTRPVIVLIEDMDAIINQYGESDLLAMLDGEHQTDNVVFIATTNYPQELDKRFINRPSRFDEIIQIGMPTEDARLCYLRAKNKRLNCGKNKHELNEWVSITSGYSIAHLKELIISVECFGKSLESASSRLRIMIDATASTYNNSAGRSIGFGSTGDDSSG